MKLYEMIQVGDRLEHATVINLHSEHSKKNGTRKCWLLLCECGTEFVTREDSLTSGHTVSCGCISKKNLNKNRFKHGKHATRTYRIWAGIKRRASFGGDYFDKGIFVCTEWLEFENFYNDMGDAPDGCSIDRIDNYKGYSKDNCRWATNAQQARNKRSNINIQYQGRTMCLADWAIESGINEDTLYARLVRYKWPLEKAMTEPVHDKCFSYAKSLSLEKHADESINQFAIRNGISWPTAKRWLDAGTLRSITTP